MQNSWHTFMRSTNIACIPLTVGGGGGLEVKRWVWGLILGSQGGASGLPIRITKGGGLTTSLIIDTQYLFLWHIQM